MYPEFFDIRRGFFLKCKSKTTELKNVSSVLKYKQNFMRKKRECRQINTYTKLIFAHSSFFLNFDWLFVYNSFISKVLVNKNDVSCYIVGYVMISFLFFLLFFLVRNRCASNAYIQVLSSVFSESSIYFFF